MKNYSFFLYNRSFLFLCLLLNTTFVPLKAVEEAIDSTSSMNLAIRDSYKDHIIQKKERITLRVIDRGRDTIVLITTTPNTTIGEIKYRIREATGSSHPLDPKNCHMCIKREDGELELVSRCKVLKHSELTLADYGIIDDNLLTVIFRVCGGGGNVFEIGDPKLKFCGKKIPINTYQVSCQSYRPKCPFFGKEDRQCRRRTRNQKPRKAPSPLK